MIGLIILRAYLAELHFHSKELQTESVNWTSVQHELTRVLTSLDTITDDQLLKDAEKFFKSIGESMI